MPLGILLSALSDAAISIEGTVVANNEVVKNISKAGTSSAIATITITMYTRDDE